MGKRRNYNQKEQDQLKKLKVENKQLKREVSSLRKQLNQKEIQEFYEDVQTFEQVDEDVELNKLWECFQCERDVIRLVIIDRNDGTFYFRRCQSCGNKTKLQKYNPDVEGIK